MINKDRKNGFLSFLWLKINDLKSAQEAAVFGAWGACYIAFSYLIQLLFIFFTGSTTDNIYAQNYLEYYILLSGFFLVIVFTIFVAYRIYKKQEFGYVPFISLWLLLEIGYSILTKPRGGFIFIAIFFTAISINSFRGWIGVKKYQQK